MKRDEARRIVLRAQGFGKSPNIDDVVGATQLLQIDSVNVLVRAHYMPLFSRLGPYDRAKLDEAAWGKRKSLFEYWVHEASLVPLQMHPLLRWRMHRARDGVGVYKRLARFAKERRSFVDEVRERIRKDGPMGAGAFESQRRGAGWWSWSDAKVALEYLFWAGELTTSTRRNFERIYDLTERVIPSDILALPTPSEVDAHRELVRRAVKALGVASKRDISDYFRTAIKDTDPRIKELVDAGTITAVKIEGMKNEHYMLAGTKVPKPFACAALLCPFDPIVWKRDRTHALFDFHYRIEIYTPAHKRKHGYYVFPFLYNGQLVARVDLKADRANDTLLVQATHGEPNAGQDEARALADELARMATWLGLARIKLGAKGSYAKHLRAALRPELTR